MNSRLLSSKIVTLVLALNGSVDVEEFTLCGVTSAIEKIET